MYVVRHPLKVSESIPQVLGFFFPVVVIKYPNKSNLRDKGFVLAHCSKLESITTGKSTQQGHEVANRIHSQEQTEG